MRAYIKDFYSFRTLAQFNLTTYSFAVGEQGSASIHVDDDIDVQTAYSGDWLVASDGSVWYISAASPDGNYLSLTLKEPCAAFDRLGAAPTATTWGGAIAELLNRDYVLGGGDSVYALSYINVSNADSTPCSIEADDYGNVSLASVVESAAENGVYVSASIGAGSSSIVLSIAAAPASTVNVVLGASKNQIESESYEDATVAKLTVVQKQTSGSTSTTTYYLASDGSISSTEPAERARGRWETITCEASDNPLEKATEMFNANTGNHKIEFRSMAEIAVGQRVNLRLRGKVFTTTITAAAKSGSDARTLYKCGSMRVTLIDKLRDII